MQNAKDLTVDVVVIGGGPGGSAAATMMARKGLKVLLLERERFPREHVGESLLPPSMPVLEALGVLPAVHQAGFLKKWGATMVWGRETTPWSWYFRETNRSYPHTFQVWRPRFDQILLENSRDNGVDAREGRRVTEVTFEDEGEVRVRYVAEGEGERTATARWVVDASGQSAVLQHKFHTRRWDTWFQNLVVYAYFDGAQRLPPPDENNIFIEAYTHGWFWNIPLHTGWMSVGAVVDKQVGGEGVRRRGPVGFLEEQIASAPGTSRMLRDARMVSGPFVLRDWSYDSANMVGDRYVLVGDAACFIDPLFSSGVHLALSAGVLAAAYVATVLKKPEMREPAGRAYTELYHQSYDQFRQMARLFYSSNRTMESYFWEARRIRGGDPLLSPRQAFIRAVAGQTPQGYERVVLKRGEAPRDFVDQVNAVETEQERRRARWAALRVHPATAQTPLYHAVPVLADGVAIERKPVVEDGEFEWGYVLKTTGQPNGTPCSLLVARLVALMDGRTSVAQLIAKLHPSAEAARHAQIELAAFSTVQILYVDGAIADLRGV